MDIRYDEMLQIPTIGRAIAIRIWELRRVRTITPELLATIPYIKMEVVNQYIDYTSIDEFEFEDQDEVDYEEQDDLGDFDDRLTQAFESDKVAVQHDISQHQGWLESSFDKLKISEQKGRMPVVNMFKPCSFQFPNIKQAATGVQPKDMTVISQSTTNTRHPVTSTVHTGAPHEPIFFPRVTSTVGLTTMKRRKVSRQNVTPNRSDLPRPQYQNPFKQAIPQHSEPVYTLVTQFQPQANIQFQSPIIQNSIQSRVTPQFSLPGNLQSTLQVPDYSNVNMSRNFNKQTVYN